MSRTVIIGGELARALSGANRKIKGTLAGGNAKVAGKIVIGDPKESLVSNCLSALRPLYFIGHEEMFPMD
eukprot:scaffold29_cov364-Pavlova_lutheri.AAC.9